VAGGLLLNGQPTTHRSEGCWRRRWCAGEGVWGRELLHAAAAAQGMDAAVVAHGSEGGGESGWWRKFCLELLGCW
jgi:hypothetical protein